MRTLFADFPPYFFDFCLSGGINIHQNTTLHSQVRNHSPLSLWLDGRDPSDSENTIVPTSRCSGSFSWARGTVPFGLGPSGSGVVSSSGRTAVPSSASSTRRTVPGWAGSSGRCSVPAAEAAPPSRRMVRGSVG